MTFRPLLAATALFAISGLSQASPTITSLGASARTIAQGVPITYSIKGEDMENAICALQIRYGDGTSTIRHMDWGKNIKFPLYLKKTYAKPGKYTASVIGVKSGKFLKCMGSAKYSVLVTEPPVAP